MQPLLAALAVAASVPQSVSYDGHKVFRVPVHDDGAYLQSVVDKLDVSVWQPPSKKGAFADIQVAPHLVKAFEAAMSGHELITMHDDLGQSVKEESAFPIYAGTMNFSPLKCQFH